MTTTKRVHNFGAGPAALPLAVLEQVQGELLDFAGTGMSVMEISHRSPAFGQVIEEAEADLRTLLGLSDDHAVLFLQGGASLQFSMVPANLRVGGASADYVMTGNWSKAAYKEADKGGSARAVGSTEPDFDRVPAQGEIDFDPQAAYVHFTSNNTIYGTQWSSEPEPPSGVPLVCDASSDVLSRPLDINRYGVLYAGAQKNLGPAGIAVVVVRRDLLERTPGGLPALMDYRLMAEKRSLYNTPPTLAVYVVGRVLRWLVELGGLAEIGKRNETKAALLYGAIDGSGGFYRGHAQPDSRSRMNVTFRLASEDLEKEFLKEAGPADLAGLKGHRSVGGLRASIYNACPIESVRALVDFMADFPEAPRLSVKEPDLEELGWGPFFSEAWTPFASEGLIPARVVVAHARAVRVRSAEGEGLAGVSGRLRHAALSPEDLPAVGDWVALRPREGGGRTLVHAVLPRRTAFVRRAPGEITVQQVLAANVDTIFLVMGLDRDYNPRRIERALVLAWESGADPVVLLNKADLCEDVDARRAEIEASAPGVPVRVIAAKQGQGLEALAPWLERGRTVALLGSSGVGKSTIVNRLLGEEKQRTRAVRASDQRGRHTTTHRELVILPAGGLLLDTPGLRELQLWGSEGGLATAFEDVERLAPGCRFRDCEHGSEPGCAVRAAVEAGELGEGRLASYHKLRAELRSLEIREDPELRRAETARWRSIIKSVKAHPKRPR